jgi:DNA-binding HxlR family transcriptional regulator
MSENSHYQRANKTEHRGRILHVLRSGPMIPSEISARTGLSRSLVYARLREFVQKGCVRKRADDDRIEYSLASSAPTETETRIDLIKDVLFAITHLIRDQDWVSSILPAAKATKQDPKRSDAEAQFALGMESIIVSKDFVRWKRKYYPDAKVSSALAAELEKLDQLGKLPRKDSLEKNPQLWFRDFLLAVRNDIARPPGFNTRYFAQIKAEQDTMEALISILRNAPASFSEILDRLPDMRNNKRKVGVTHSTLTKYLDMYEKMGIVDEQMVDDRVRYVLSDEARKLRGRGVQGVRSSIMNFPHIIVSHAETLAALTDLASRNSQLVDDLLIAYEYMLLTFATKVIPLTSNRTTPGKTNLTFTDELERTLRIIGKSSNFWADFNQLTDAFLKELAVLLRIEE